MFTLSISTAHANPESTPPDPARKWYGWQSIIPTLATYALAPLVLATGDTRDVYYLEFPFVLSSLFPHAISIRGTRETGWREWRTFIGMGLRVAGPALGALVGAAVGNQLPHGATSPDDATLIGCGVGSFVAATIDIALLMWRPPRPNELRAATPVAATREGGARWSLVPTVGRGSAGLGVVGVF